MDCDGTIAEEVRQPDGTVAYNEEYTNFRMLNFDRPMKVFGDSIERLEDL